MCIDLITLFNLIYHYSYNEYVNDNTITGGAEQLVVSIACTLKSMGHAVSILTSHHDQNHCFDETKENGMKVLDRK